MKELNRGFVPGPGEVLSELHLGLDIMVLEKEITSLEAQERFSMTQRELNLLALANPGIPWDTGSTQVRELERKEKELRAAPQNSTA